MCFSFHLEYSAVLSHDLAFSLRNSNSGKFTRQRYVNVTIIRSSRIQRDERTYDNMIVWIQQVSRAEISRLACKLYSLIYGRNNGTNESRRRFASPLKSNMPDLDLLREQCSLNDPICTHSRTHCIFLLPSRVRAGLSRR
jgi:hypothetical protein